MPETAEKTPNALPTACDTLSGEDLRDAVREIDSIKREIRVQNDRWANRLDELRKRLAVKAA